MKGIFDQMLSQYDTSTAASLRNATFEVMQQIVLAGLQRGGFFDKASFYGGTCLRIFHGLQKIQTNFETDFNVAMFITRDDDGNFVVTTNSEGIGFGGKSIEDPFRMENQIDTGISVYGMKRYFSCGDCYITADGNTFPSAASA